jgi:ubiquitin-like protein Pup
MAQAQQKKSPQGNKQSEPVVEKKTDNEDSELDDLLEEIDEVLEEDAETFVGEYQQ